MSIKIDAVKHLLAFGLSMLQMVTKNGFWLLILQQSKNFSHQAYGDKKCLIANLVTIENFKSPSDTPPPSNGNSNFLVVQESKGWDPFFSRMILHTPPPFLGTENFQSPFDIPQLLDDHQKTLVVERARASTIILGEKKSSLLSLLGNQRISIAIQLWWWVRWQLEFFGHFKSGTRDGNQNLRSPSNTPS